MENQRDLSPPNGPSRRGEITWEIVCPDGGVRHFPYSSKDDAKYDATLCTAEGCQIFPESQWLQGAQPPCSGGPHRIVRSPMIQRDSNVTGDLGHPASP